VIWRSCADALEASVLLLDGFGTSRRYRRRVASPLVDGVKAAPSG
jgi:hypothetical protein